MMCVRSSTADSRQYSAENSYVDSGSYQWGPEAMPLVSGSGSEVVRPSETGKFCVNVTLTVQIDNIGSKLHLVQNMPSAVISNRYKGIVRLGNTKQNDTKCRFRLHKMRLGIYQN